MSPGGRFPGPWPKRLLQPPWFLALAAVLLFLRKPHALTHAQLWAEDGSIFLSFNDAFGLQAFLEPYMGYLHTLPRIVAWAAPLALDPLWWPTFYNGVAFAIWVAVLARIFSPRLDWPGRPWLALALVIGPHTGEVLFNITNLQWVTALVLLQQAVIRPPITWPQRLGDLALLALLGLTGPFVAILGPLFLWRWWRDRRRDNLVVLLFAAAGAVTQLVLILRTGPHFTFPPFDAGRFGGILAQRLIVWPLVGDHLAVSFRSAATGWVLLALLAAFLAWTLRPHPRRHLRLPVAAALVFLLVALVSRSRPDTWSYDNLVFADRYFFLPRVLLLWLVAWEFDASNPWIRRAAVVAFALVALAHVRTHRAPAPPDMHWAQHVDAIRRGEPANIPSLPEGHTLEYRGRPTRR